MRYQQEHELAAGNGLPGFNGDYADRLSRVAEVGGYAAGPAGFPDGEEGADEALLSAPLLAGGGEDYEFAALSNLDTFFTRVYRYWSERGLRSILLSGALNLLALAFTAAFSAFLLLFVNWRALHAECLQPRASGAGAGPSDPSSPGGDPGGGGSTPGGCDLLAVAIDRRPLLGRGLAADLLALSYLGVCAGYLAWTALHYVADWRDMREVAHFMANKLGISEAKVVGLPWAEVAHRLVLVQRTTRLCIARDLDELHIVARIMRKDNYLISMINKGVLRLHLQPPSAAPAPLRRAVGVLLAFLAGGGGGGPTRGSATRGSAPALTKTLEWNLRWCILDHMFDERFRIRPEFMDVAALRRRLRLLGLANALLSPFLLLFLLAHFFMRHAERLYHHPAALGSRRWSGLARWTIRELNELPHHLHHRLSASHPAALRYLAQFPAHTLAALARFVVFVTGSFVALLLLVAFLDESLLERPLGGRQLVWWLGTSTLLLAAARNLVSDEPVAYDPERALAEVVGYTHHLPRAWRGRAAAEEVQAAFLSLFRLRVALFAEELLSLLTTPLLLAAALPDCAESIVEFVSTFTTHVDGVGDVCSLALYDLARHGNTKYGSPVQADKPLRSRQGKMEKSFLTFVATYPTWEPDELGRRMLAALAAAGGGAGAGGAAMGGGDAAAEPRPAPDSLPFHQAQPSAFPYQAAAAVGPAAEAARANAAAAAALARAGSGGLRGPHSGVAEEGGKLAGPTGKQPHLHPYHGVRSYTSSHTGCASHMSAGGQNLPRPLHVHSHGHGADRPMGHYMMPSCPGGAGPSPSVASSQFTCLPSPYHMYYPTPLYYAQHQQERHAQQQQQRQQYGTAAHGRHQMYEQLMYGVPTMAGSAAAAAAMRRPGAAPRFGGAGSWQWQPGPPAAAVDGYGGMSYSGLFPPPGPAFLGGPHGGGQYVVGPAPPHMTPQRPAAHWAATVHGGVRGQQGAAAAAAAAAMPHPFQGPAPAGAQAAAAPVSPSHSRQHQPPERAGDGGGAPAAAGPASSRAGATPPAAAAAAELQREALRSRPPAQQPPSPRPLPTPGPCSSAGMGTASCVDVAASMSASASGGGATGGGGGASMAGTGTTGTGGGSCAPGTGSDVLDLRGLEEPPAAASSGNDAGGGATASQYDAGVSQYGTPLDRSAMPGLRSQAASRYGASSVPWGAGTGVGTATGVEVHGGGGGGGTALDDDPLGFVELSGRGPAAAAAAVAAAEPCMDAFGLGLMEDVEGFGLVPEPAGQSAASAGARPGAGPRRWAQGAGAGASGGGGSASAAGAAPYASASAEPVPLQGHYYDAPRLAAPQRHGSQPGGASPAGPRTHPHSPRGQLLSDADAAAGASEAAAAAAAAAAAEAAEAEAAASDSQLYCGAGYYAAAPECSLLEYGAHDYGFDVDGYGMPPHGCSHGAASHVSAGAGAAGWDEQASYGSAHGPSCHGHVAPWTTLPLEQAAAAAADGAALRSSVFGAAGGAGWGTDAAAAARESFTHAARAPSSAASTPSAAMAMPSPAAALPPSEVDELQRRMSRGHALLNSLYESNDHTVRHRRQQQQHARAVSWAAGARAPSAGGAGAGAGDGVGAGQAGGGASPPSGSYGLGGSRGLGWAPPGAEW